MRTSPHHAAIVCSLVLLASLGTPPCEGRTLQEIPTSPHRNSLDISQEDAQELFAEVVSDDKTGTDVNIERSQRYSSVGSARKVFRNGGTENRMAYEGKDQVAQGHDNRKAVILSYMKNVNQRNAFQVEKKDNLLEMIPSLVDKVTDIDFNEEYFLPAWLRHWISSIFGDHQTGGGQGLDEGSTTAEGGEGVTESTEDTSEWIVTTEEATPTTSTTTTEDVMAEYCNNACKEGTAGLECGCPEHPIG